MSQVHSKFKAFICSPVNSQLDPKVIAEAAEFFQQPGRVARSIGIEYLEQPDKLVLSIGYSEEPGAAAQPIKIECVSLGRLTLESQVIEAAMEAAASKAQNVICHEFYVDDAEFFMVLLSLA
jgi:hypothetical protein